MIGLESDALRRFAEGAIWIQLGFGSVALLGAAAAGGVRQRLGLAPGRLPAGAVALLVVATLGLSHALDSILTLLALRDDSALGTISDLLSGARGADLAMALLFVGVLPGITEELLCRGLVQRSATARLGAPAGVAISAGLFAALHLEPVHAALAAPLGLHLALIAHRTGSTRAAIGCHVANNLGAVLLGALELPTATLPALHIGLGLALTALCWAAVLRLGQSTLQPPPGSVDR